MSEALEVRDSAIQLGSPWIEMSEVPSTAELRAIWELSAKIEAVSRGFDAALQSAEAAWAEQLRRELITASKLVSGLGERLVTARSVFERENVVLQGRITVLEIQTNFLEQKATELAEHIALLELPWWRKLKDWARGWFR